LSRPRAQQQQDDERGGGGRARAVTLLGHSTASLAATRPAPGRGALAGAGVAVPSVTRFFCGASPAASLAAGALARAAENWGRCLSGLHDLEHCVGPASGGVRRRAHRRRLHKRQAAGRFVAEERLYFRAVE
jgi:hypothetical protein